MLKELREMMDSPEQEGQSNGYDYEEFAQMLGVASSRGEPVRAKDEVNQPIKLRFDREGQRWIHELTRDTFDTEELATLLYRDNEGQLRLAY